MFCMCICYRVAGRIGLELCMCQVYNMIFLTNFPGQYGLYREFLVTGKFDFTQFDPVVAKKHTGLQGPNWEENSINRFL